MSESLKTYSNNFILQNTLHYTGYKKKKSTVCNYCSMMSLSPWFPFISCICTDNVTLHVKRVIVSLSVYKWLLLLQITVTVFYAILRLMANYKHNFYLFKACLEYPFTPLKPSKKALQYHILHE